MSGIYRTDAGLMVKKDEGEPADDYGPFATAREALIATLPTDYSMSGPEYYSPVDVARLEPDPAVAAKVAELEAKAEALWDARLAVR